MIYVGYPCIGKSSIAGQDNFIDLESSLFNDGSDNWEKKYVNVAIELASQGYDVFVSSHKQVRETLKEMSVLFVCIFPDLKLENEWFNRTAQRYKLNPIKKNLDALQRVTVCYREDISDLLKEKNIMVIRTLDDYELKTFCRDTDNLSPEWFRTDVCYYEHVNKKTNSDLWENEVEDSK